jgi:hypothetical protein
LFGFGLVLGVSSSWATDAVTLPDIPAGASDGLAVFSGGTPNTQFIPEPVGGETVQERIIGLIIPSDVLPPFTGAVNLTDPVTGAISDMISTEPFPEGGTVLDFVSDPFITPGSPTGVVQTLVETGGWQDISSYFNLPAETLFAFSDVETPEPTTLALLGSGLIGLVMIRRRRLGRAAARLA